MAFSASIRICATGSLLSGAVGVGGAGGAEEGGGEGGPER